MPHDDHLHGRRQHFGRGDGHRQRDCIEADRQTEPSERADLGPGGHEQRGGA
jgi:hypothetical protein